LYTKKRRSLQEKHSPPKRKDEIPMDDQGELEKRAEWGGPRGRCSEKSLTSKRGLSNGGQFVENRGGGERSKASSRSRPGRGGTDPRGPKEKRGFETPDGGKGVRNKSRDSDQETSAWGGLGNWQNQGRSRELAQQVERRGGF